MSEELDSTMYTVVDENWAGRVPAQYGVAPRVRIGRSKWFNLLWLLPIGFVVAIVAVATAKGIRGLPAVESFIEEYPGLSELPADAPVGFPAWLGWQHFLNAFFMIFIVRSGITILADHPRLYWVRHSTPGSVSMCSNHLWTGPIRAKPTRCTMRG